FSCSIRLGTLSRVMEPSSLDWKSSRARESERALRPILGGGMGAFKKDHSRKRPVKSARTRVEQVKTVRARSTINMTSPPSHYYDRGRCSCGEIVFKAGSFRISSE